jgi:hypothetical protein
LRSARGGLRGQGQGDEENERAVGEEFHLRVRERAHVGPRL